MSVVSASFGIVYDVKSVVSKSGAIEYDVRSRVTKSGSMVYDVRSFVYPGKVFSAKYSVRHSVGKSFSVKYGVRVPIASPKTGVISYNVRSRVTKSPLVIQYDTNITGSGVVSKSFTVVYHTLVTPTVNKVTTTPVEHGTIPPQIVTTSF